jgi:hypothetical protein
MPFNYLAAFPLPEAELPDRLRSLLTPVGLLPEARVEVAARQDLGRDIGRREFLQMVMAVIPKVPEPLASLRETTDGLVEHSTPWVESEGALARYVPSISGHDYVVAAWGDNSFYSYHLAEKIWMALGLTARCVGNNRQRLVYDDLSLPEYAVAEGDISSEFEWRLKKDVLWTMSNARLREYLWMRGAMGARVFFYEASLPDTPGLRAVMGGQGHFNMRLPGDWCELDLREHEGALLLQVWATVVAVSSERCAVVSADGLVWPGSGAMTATVADALVD